MKTYSILLAFLLCGAIALGQNTKDDPRRQLDSMRAEILAPKLRKYVQQVEKFEQQMSHAAGKKQRKEYAHEIAQVSDAMEDQVASLYDGYSSPRGTFYLGGGIGPWGFYPGLGMMGYPGNYYYANLPPVYNDIDRIKRYANNMRMFTWPRNVRRKEVYIKDQLDILKTETASAEHPVSVK